MSDINEDVVVDDEVVDTPTDGGTTEPDVNNPTDGEETIDPDDPTDDPTDEPTDEVPPEDEPTTEELSPEEKRKIIIMRHAYQKLDNLPLGFGLPAYDESISDEVVSKYFSLDLSDTLRESKITTINLVQEDSYDEMVIENRVVYHALKRFRLTSATFFKFSTATDGKTVDKTNVPKMLQQILTEYDNEYKSWKSKGAGSLWNRTATLNYTNV